jgi:hypothetical protein
MGAVVEKVAKGHSSGEGESDEGERSWSRRMGGGLKGSEKI